MRKSAARWILEPTHGIILDDRIRGIPPGISELDSLDVARMGWHPAEGLMPLPVLTMDEAAYTFNRDAMMNYVRHAGVDIAPHAKTPMSPDLARDLVYKVAWA